MDGLTLAKRKLLKTCLSLCNQYHSKNNKKNKAINKEKQIIIIFFIKLESLFDS